MKMKSLRFRIAATIFILQAIMMVAILWPTLNSSFNDSKKQIANTEKITLKTLAELGRIAFLTDEYNDLQPFLEIAVLDQHVLEAVLLNPQNVVYASHDTRDIGSTIQQFENTGKTYWRSQQINNAAGNLGSLNIRFSKHHLETANLDTLILGSAIAVLGLMLSAIAGIILGNILTRRLNRLNQTASKFAKGDFSVRADSHHDNDEINELAITFNHMADDISEAMHTLRESESRFRGIFFNANDAIFLIDTENDRIVDANPAACKMLKYNIKELLKTPVSAIHLENTHDLQAFTQQVFENGSAITEELICTTKNNKKIAVSISASLISIDDKILLLVQTRDISQRKQYEKSLRRAQKMEAVGQLTGGIAHDFNNILGIILGNLDLLNRQLKTDDKIQKRLDNIKYSAQRAADLTKKLLGFSSSDNSITTITNINQVITDIHNLLARSLTPQIEIMHHLADDLWLTEIDAGDFEDVLLNMALNARDAMAGSGNLTIETRNCVLDEAYCKNNVGAVPGEYVQLAISDNGEGMPLEIQDRIFEPFFTTKEVGKGTGLGLAMVFGFIERSGGSIKVYSEAGIGTTFRLYLPRALREKQEKKATENGVGTNKLPGGKDTILVVDDETALIELVKETLQALGYKVLTATNASVALQVLATEATIDLMFSDIIMPGGMNGFELAEQACKQYPLLKVLLTSGYTDMAIARNGQAQFKANLLSKPYTQEELTLRIRKTLDE